MKSTPDQRLLKVPSPDATSNPVATAGCSNGSSPLTHVSARESPARATIAISTARWRKR